MEQTMGNKFFNFITNIVLSVIVCAVVLVGFSGKSVTMVSLSEHENVFYRNKSSDCPQQISLMFNVYQNTQQVEQILDILQEHNVKATFFLGGCWADDNVDCVKHIVQTGNEIGTHGYFHKSHDKLSYEQNLTEIRPSISLLKQITGITISLFAPPSGAYNKETINACISLQLKTILWSIDTIDWRDQDAALIYNRATKKLKAGDFILMHPTPKTVEALPKILTYISEQGFMAQIVSLNLGE